MVGRYVTIAIPTHEEYLTLCEVEIYGVPDVNENGTNVALRGTTIQSSLLDLRGLPEHAIDGNRDSVYGSLSCTHTEHEMGPWWRVDLQQPYRISDVLITNRGDCCWERLKGAEIHIGNSLEKNGTLNHRCASVSKVRRGSTESFCCGELEGRYVTITIPGREEYLTLCEVEVYGSEAPTTQNVALKGTALQSSKRDQLGVPEHAIDGNKNSDFGYLSCTHTAYEMGPWWRVDLQQPYRISAVVITNRGDCCWERLRGAEIYIGNSLEKNGTLNPRCASISTVERGSTDSFCCNGMVGRYVTIAIPTRVEYLTLCEVEVYGIPDVNRCRGNQNASHWHSAQPLLWEANKQWLVMNISAVVWALSDCNY
ncbi:uncharacterized protein LOC135352566 [Latimeria chalumnae]|uniref:uncharacterized protein LOC135352566 n=1 Tax=Latimeria chalumnae TaxID=7897 RepID=UPI00313DA6C2